MVGEAHDFISVIVPGTNRRFISELIGCDHRDGFQAGIRFMAVGFVTEIYVLRQQIGSFRYMVPIRPCLHILLKVLKVFLRERTEAPSIVKLPLSFRILKQ